MHAAGHSSSRIQHEKFGVSVALAYLPSRPQNGRLISNLVGSTADLYGADAEAAEAFRVCVSESFDNVAVHATGARDREGVVAYRPHLPSLGRSSRRQWLERHPTPIRNADRVVASGDTLSERQRRKWR
jgi:hypothetical protein